LQNSSYVPGTLPTDLSPEEIQKRLHDVLQENLQLKGSFDVTVPRYLFCGLVLLQYHYIV
jgi:hypothetical protein